MGTRALVKIVDVDDSELCNIFLQCDGYPEGMMFYVAKFLSKRALVNGYTKYDEVNGMDDLASQVVTLLKLVRYELVSPLVKGRECEWFNNNDDDQIHRMILAGGVYVMKPNTSDVGEEWIYVIRPDEKYKKFVDAMSLMRLRAKPIIEVYRKKANKELEIVWRGYPEDYVKAFNPEK